MPLLGHAVLSRGAGPLEGLRPPYQVDAALASAEIAKLTLQIVMDNPPDHSKPTHDQFPHERDVQSMVLTLWEPEDSTRLRSGG